MMVIEKNRVVSIDYTLKDDDGEVLDSSEGSDPLVYLHGNDNIIPGLEKHLDGKKAGDSLSCVVPAAEAYGDYDDELVFEVPRDKFQDMGELEVGMQFRTDSGPGVVTVTKIEKDTITVDANHPLAGENLHFDVKVMDIREATSEELSKGHPHHECGCDGDCEDEESDCDCGHHH
jgi:FKBP-type peptidyl-prolyl cis-trans isomerase SlyD